MKWFLPTLATWLVMLALPTSCRLGESVDDFTAGAPDASGGGAAGGGTEGGSGSGGTGATGGTGGSGGCGGGSKVCAGQSVCVDDPAHGCQPYGCEPCVLPHAIAGCSSGFCKVDKCEPGYGDCNQTAGDGCETRTASDLAHCGSCQAPCSASHATTTCEAGACQMAGCQAPWKDCNQSALDGCEVDSSSDKDNCGTCGSVCTASGNATPACVSGICGGDCGGGYLLAFDITDGAGNDMPDDCGWLGQALFGYGSRIKLEWWGTAEQHFGPSEWDLTPSIDSIRQHFQTCQESNYDLPSSDGKWFLTLVPFNSTVAISQYGDHASDGLVHYYGMIYMDQVSNDEILGVDYPDWETAWANRFYSGERLRACWAP